MIKSVLLFAAAKERVGQDVVRIELPDDASVADLRKRLSKEYPEIENLVARSFVAIDQEFAAEDRAVAEATEIALIPPVSGG